MSETRPIVADADLPPYNVQRRTLLHDNSCVHQRVSGESNVWHRLQTIGWLQLLHSLVPVMSWLPTYSIRHSLCGDLIAGLTVAVMHIPQGMAYGLLAGVAPITGLYMAVYPPLAYFVFGTSPRISIGSMSIASVMASPLVEKHTQQLFTAEEVASGLAVVCGLHMMCLCALQAGSMAALLSESLTSSFTVASGVHVIVRLLRDLFGLPIPVHRHGYFTVVRSLGDFVVHLPHINYPTLYTSLAAFGFQAVMIGIVEPLVDRLCIRHCPCRIAVPVELLTIGGGTLISYAFDFGDRYSINLVGDVPLGLPMPQVPAMRLMSDLMLEALPLTLVSFALTVAMGKQLAGRQSDDAVGDGIALRANQELLALGISNVLGGCFWCLPAAGSITRSLVQEQAGGHTQVTSLVSAALICGVLLWIGPLFRHLPRCVMSAVILVSIRRMFGQFLRVPHFHRESRLHSVTWILTFLVVVFVDIVLGLTVGLAISVVSYYWNGMRTEHCQLGQLPGTGNVYACVVTHAAARAVPGVFIFRFIGAVNFTNAATFKEALDEDRKSTTDASPSLVLDLSGVTHLDVTGVKMLHLVQQKQQQQHQRPDDDRRPCTVLAAPNDGVFAALRHAERLDYGPFVVFASVHDSVLFCTATTATTVDSVL